MIFLEVSNGLVELTGASLELVPDEGLLVLMEQGDGASWVLFAGPEPDCRAVLNRIIEKLDHVNREVVIRRADYQPEATP